MGETAEIWSESDVWESEQMATDALAELAAGFESEEADACMTEFFLPSDDDFEFGEIEIGPLSLTPPAGVDESRAWQAVIPIEGASGTESEGVSVPVYLDIVALHEGDTIVLVTSIDLVTPFDPELRDQLIDTIADRMIG
jgi:hypothetical protein